MALSSDFFSSNQIFYLFRKPLLLCLFHPQFPPLSISIGVNVSPVLATTPKGLPCFFTLANNRSAKRLIHAVTPLSRFQLEYFGGFINGCEICNAKVIFKSPRLVWTTSYGGFNLKVNISVSASHCTPNAFMQGSSDSSMLTCATRSSTGTSRSTSGLLLHQRRILKPALPSSSLSWSRALIASSSVSNEVILSSMYICNRVMVTANG